jgi:hypothetical protein
MQASGNMRRKHERRKHEMWNTVALGVFLGHSGIHENKGKREPQPPSTIKT